jgi:hypothetical protein
MPQQLGDPEVSMTIVPDRAVESLANDLRLNREDAKALVEAISVGASTPAVIGQLAHSRAWTYNEAEFYIGSALRFLVQRGYVEDSWTEQQIQRGPPPTFVQACGPVARAAVDDEGGAHEQVRARLAVAPVTFVYPAGAPNFGLVRDALLSGGVVRVWTAPAEIKGQGSVVRIWQLEKEGQTIVWYSDTAAYYAGG